ncbi:Sedlin [Xylariaceae sp. FL1651]|nr:Sedlin [Xylariaceae sp. FL1651]
MANTVPSIACLGVIGRNKNPLHITIFPSYDSTTQTFAPVRTSLQFSLLLSGTLDVFETRSRHHATSGAGAGGGSMLLSGDFGLLHAVDDRLAAYGFETNTGVKFVAVVDMRGRLPSTTINNTNTNTSSSSGNTNTPGGGGAGSRGGGGGLGGGIGLRDTELKPVFRAMQTAYVRLLLNPFYEPDETAALGEKGGASAKRITSQRFEREMRRIGEAWAPGVTSL